MAKPGHKGIRRLVLAAGFSVSGLCAAWRHEAAFRQECGLALLLLPCALLLAETWTQAALLVAATLAVLVVELLNSAIEAVVDLVAPQAHELAGRAKDMGAAAVFVSLLMAVFVWALVAAQRFA